jgi:hypothetical protein
MGIHEFPCPTCYSKQRVKAQAGEVVEIKDCDACRQTKDFLASGEASAEDVKELTQAFVKKHR